MESAAGTLICVVIFLIGSGLLQIFARDFMWELTHWSNQIAGRVSERTDTWDSWQAISGVILILIGVGVGCWAWSLTAQQNTRDAEQTAVYQTREATQVLFVQQLDNEFSEVVPSLQANARTERQRVFAPDVGLPLGRVTELEYGRCEDNEAFYLYVINYRGRREDFAYTSVFQQQRITRREFTRRRMAGVAVPF